MAWAATDNLESYSAGDLDTLNGGSGWSTAWSGGGTDWDVDASSTIQGTNAAKIAGAVGPDVASRDFTSITAGQFSIQMRAKGNSGYVLLQDGATIRGRISIGQNTDHTLEIYNGTVYSSIGTFTDSVNFTLEVDFGGQGGVCSSTEYRARKDGGTWTSCVSMPAAGNVNRLAFEYADAAARELWFDDIKSTETAAAATAYKSNLPLLGIG